jgi:hypothetical protein
MFFLNYFELLSSLNVDLIFYDRPTNRPFNRPSNRPSNRPCLAPTKNIGTTNTLEISQDLKEFIGNKLFSDVEIVVKESNGIIVPAHKVILHILLKFLKL